MFNRTSWVFMWALGVIYTMPLASLAQSASYPSKNIRWVVPYPAGGGSDFLARTISQQLSVQLKQSILIDNKPGANTAIAAADVAHAPADGHTILSADNGTMVFNPALYAKLSYNPEKDLVPVTLMGKFPMILVVGPSSDAKDAKDFIRKAKAKPGSVNFGSAGAGSPHHLAMELLKVHAGLFMVHIPYRGAAPALTDLAGGQIPAMMVDLAAGAGFIKSGKIRALAVANPVRLAQLPDVPTFAELGFKNVEAAALVGIVAPAGTPEAVLKRMADEAVAWSNTERAAKLRETFAIPNKPKNLADTRKDWEGEVPVWIKLAVDLGIKLD